MCCVDRVRASGALCHSNLGFQQEVRPYLTKTIPSVAARKHRTGRGYLLQTRRSEPSRMPAQAWASMLARRFCSGGPALPDRHRSVAQRRWRAEVRRYKCGANASCLCDRLLTNSGLGGSWPEKQIPRYVPHAPNCGAKENERDFARDACRGRSRMTLITCAAVRSAK